MKRLSLVFFLLAISSLLFAAPAMAARIESLWISSDGELGEDAIKWYSIEKNYYLFLPGNINPAEMKIGFSGVDTINVNGKKYHSGESAAIFPLGEMFVIKNGDTKHNVCVMQGSPGLPAIYIQTDSGSLKKIHESKENKEKGALLFVNPNGEIAYNGDLTHIKMRGNSSTTFKKKNYQIKLENGTNLMEMGKSRTWILTGNSRDKSLLRNQITLDMAMYAALAYTPEHISAEVYINHEYMGVYLFSEKVMIDDDRIDIANLEEASEELNGNLEAYERIGPTQATPGQYKAYDIPEDPDDISGGYLIEFESYSKRYKEEASAYYTTRKNTLVIKSPEYCSAAEMEYISSYMQAFENAIFSADGCDPDTGKHYSEWVDMESLVEKYMIEEITKNYDGNSSSMFFYKPADDEGRTAFAGPVWDYDSAYGSYAQEHNKQVLEGNGFWINNDHAKKYWWPALYKQADFRQAVKEKYAEVFKPALEILLGIRPADQAVLCSLDDYALKIETSAAMNFQRWPALKNPSTVANTGHTFEMNIDYLKNFLQERYEFLNKEWALNP